ncbi:MAG: hypothetical protein KBB94_06125 [Legionellaceae bacterium]|nr:hypothetical protein [Legionellaceae bacterium]MBP9775909.1 hypothetical protein [Legionellaceae bacterium]
MNEFDIDKAYVSTYDEFLKKFDREHALTESQLKEIKTYQRINALRDGTDPTAESEKIWEDF